MKKLTEDERYFIEQELSNNQTQKWIAEQLGRSASSISREVSRNSCSDGVYRFHLAHERSQKRKQYRTVCPKLTIGVLRRQQGRAVGISRYELLTFSRQIKQIGSRGPLRLNCGIGR